jgi:hypothetical protein
MGRKAIAEGVRPSEGASCPVLFDRYSLAGAGRRQVNEKEKSLTTMAYCYNLKFSMIKRDAC